MISVEEQLRRAELVALARRAAEDGGHRSGQATRELQDAYVRGELELDELVTHAQVVLV